MDINSYIKKGWKFGGMQFRVNNTGLTLNDYETDIVIPDITPIRTAGPIILISAQGQLQIGDFPGGPNPVFFTSKNYRQYLSAFASGTNPALLPEFKAWSTFATLPIAEYFLITPEHPEVVKGFVTDRFKVETDFNTAAMGETNFNLGDTFSLFMNFFITYLYYPFGTN